MNLSDPIAPAEINPLVDCDVSDAGNDEAKFKAAVANFIKLLTAFSADYMAKTFPNLTPPSYVITPGGKKYLRVATVDASHGGRSVYCFIGVADGGIYKAAGWKAPAKTARGNIYNANPLDGCGPYGPNYLR